MQRLVLVGVGTICFELFGNAAGLCGVPCSFYLALGRKMTMSYEQILTLASKEADAFSLTWRQEFRFSKKAAHIEKKLKPHQRNEQITSSWPGTDLVGSTALVRTYGLNEATLAVLSEVPGIFSWLAPHYPEDLAFYNNGAVVFWSIAHEKEAGFAAQPTVHGSTPPPSAEPRP